MLTREKAYNIEHNSVSVNVDTCSCDKKEEKEMPPDIKIDECEKIKKENIPIKIPPLDFSQISQSDFDQVASENAYADFLKNSQNNIKNDLPIGESTNNISSPEQIQCLLKMWRLVLIDYMEDCKIFNLLYDQKLDFVKYHIDPIINLCDLNVPYGNIIRKLHMAISYLYDIISVNKMHYICTCKEKLSEFNVYEDLCLKLFNTILYIQNYEIKTYL